MGNDNLLIKVSSDNVAPALELLGTAGEAPEGLSVVVHTKDNAAIAAAIDKAYGFMGRLRERNVLPD
ncbi:hypothetical protein [Cohnella silvisoli]|uniref:Uncharacterized protein n=1 Tax=Cohnella silvisoli TaxID=2873699 RepID=A0ABV1KUE5_9BACL|nr:hypothetical protein [Cohnella silvisoli]MCD9023105.1 hypothetical protein [Cohnella silvisoli]